MVLGSSWSQKKLLKGASVKISIVCSNPNHPVNDYLIQWISKNSNSHQIVLCRKISELLGGEILFLISCDELVPSEVRALYGVTLVLHASDLPIGRGWSPHIWEIVSGSRFITLSLLEAEDAVDSGNIWKKIKILIPDHALWDEINHLLFLSEIELLDFALKFYGKITPVPQSLDITPTYYMRRNLEHSKLDPFASISDQFDLMRVCDPNRYPAFFEYRGHKYKIKLEKISDE